ncbi:cAMP-dependent protein kinase regulatory subunit (PKA regulatory subunit) [Durusdinium trenchii]|uniref:cAMP-dependent protein kinase regulatory subunit (PKA regulatory subunit) n=1 Tax=Durusdinium trenchii TaxID=1381693 RepID=A0ABP0JF60_9DINO
MAPSCWSCWSAWFTSNVAHGQVVEDMHLCREDFEEIVTFLASVPLFKTQLPRSELPKVAQKLKRKEWQRGQDIVKQGDLGKAFYLIMSGEAEVFTQSEDEPGIVRAVLRKGDYWGGRSLMEERNNVATIRPAGKEPVVTLSMSRKAFHDSGISQLLRFPKRAAIHNELPAASSSEVGDRVPKSPQETLFISQAVRRNANLRALLHMTEEQLDQIVASAQRMEVKKDEEVACFGEVGDKFFILFEGSVDVVARHWA